MKVKAGNIADLQKNYLSADLLDIIEKKKMELRRVSNSALLILFWELGEKINNYTARNSKSNIANISTQLIANYGSYFSQKNLRKMDQFAQEFPDIKKVNFLISWEHILLLLNINDLEARQFYLEHKIQNGFNVQDLKKSINAGEHMGRMKHLPKSIKKEKAGFTKIPALTYELLILNEQGLENVFKKLVVPSYRKLLKPLHTQPIKFINERKKSALTGDILLHDILIHLEDFKQNQNRWLNTKLNLLFWEIGKRVNKEKHQGLFVGDLSKRLSKKYENIFSEKQIEMMSSFALKSFDDGFVFWIANELSWDHIVNLLQLEDINAIIYYTKMAVTNGLSPTQLQKEVINNKFEKASVEDKIDHVLLYMLKNPERKTTITKKKNAIRKISTVNYQFESIENSRLVQNIFDNKYFMSFMCS